MNLTALLLILKIASVFIAPANPLSKDDQTLTTCVTNAMTARPSALKFVTSKDLADAMILLKNDAKVRIHVVGTITLRDGTSMITVNHVTHGFNHTLCHQADGLLDEIVKKITDGGITARIPVVPDTAMAFDPKSPVGPWNITIQLPLGSAQPTRSTTMDLKLDGNKITGTLVSQSGPLPIAGEFVNGNLVFTVAGSDGAVQTFNGTLNPDGTLSGTMPLSGSLAVMQWKAERPKRN